MDALLKLEFLSSLPLFWKLFTTNSRLHCEEIFQPNV